MSERDDLRASIAREFHDDRCSCGQWPCSDRLVPVVINTAFIARCYRHAEAVLAVLDQQGWVPADGNYCEHGPTCSGTGPDCARAGTSQEARQRGWDEALAYIKQAEAERDAALREAARYEPSEWSSSRSASGHRLPHHAVAECDGDPSCVPLYKRVTEGEEG